MPVGPTPAPTRNLAFPPVGLAFSETAQINVANTTAPSSSATPAASSCSGTITFTSATGISVETPVKFTVAAGQIYSAPLTAAKLGVTNGSRAEFIGSVQVTVPIPVASTSTSTSGAQPLCTLTVSLETFDSVSGVTHVYLPGTVLAVYDYLQAAAR